MPDQHKTFPVEGKHAAVQATVVNRHLARFVLAGILGHANLPRRVGLGHRLLARIDGVIELRSNRNNSRMLLLGLRHLASLEANSASELCDRRLWWRRRTMPSTINFSARLPAAPSAIASRLRHIASYSSPPLDTNV